MSTKSPSCPKPSNHSWPDWKREAARRAITTYHETVTLNPFIPKIKPWNGPHLKQQIALLNVGVLELFFGGAVSGGKSHFLLMAAAQYVHVPGYAALIIRESFPDLNQPGALIPKSKEWWANSGATWNSNDKRWTFPSGATITFGYLSHDDDVYQYQGSEFQFIGFDELTQFTEPRYSYLFSRLRRLEGSTVPIRMRSASNPGGKGHEWVKKRFLSAHMPADRVFIPSKLSDNPSTDAAEYIKSLSHLDPVTRAQLERGDWNVHNQGRFRREWFRRYRWHDADTIRLDNRDELLLISDVAVIGALDPAARDHEDSDYSAMGCAGITPEKSVIVFEVIREQLSLEKIIPTLARLCDRWRPGVIGVEAVSFQAGLVNEARSHPDIGGIVTELNPQGRDKLVRATPAILLAEQRKIYVPEDGAEPWLDDFLTELQQFTGDDKKDAYDDQVDWLAYIVLMLTGHYSAGDDAPVLATRRAW